jgi:hypothetical protein
LAKSLTAPLVNISLHDSDGGYRFHAVMSKRRSKPNRNREEVLHHTPVTGMLDTTLLSELRIIFDDSEKLDRAQRIAMQVSWRLHAIVARKVGGL